MALRNILTDEDPLLRKKSREVTEYNVRIHQLMDDLADTLRDANGLGLAAPQVGVLRRAVVVVDGEEVVELINPEIIERDGEIGMREACLSLPGLSGYVVRPEKVTVRAFTRDGEEFTREFEALAARAVCHETDHLDGILFTDLAEEVHEDTEEDYEERCAKPEEKQENVRENEQEKSNLTKNRDGE